jgi:glutamyl-tRNA reductase
VAVSTRTFENAAELAAKVGGIAIPFEERCQHMAEADIIIISTSCPHTILSREEVENIVAKRKGQSLLGQSSVGQSLVIVDLAIPRNVDPEVRNVKDVFLYDLDDLENVPDHNAGERDAAAAAAQKILYAEAQGFRRKLMAERTVPTIVALRQRLDEICRKELDAFREENGPFSKDQDEMLNGVMSRMTQRIAGSLARELKELPEKVEQERMTTALQRLFHLQTPDAARAVIRSS